MRLGVSYFGNRFVEHYREHDLREIATAGCDFVVHTMSEADLAFYPTAVGALVAATHEAGLEAWLDPWGVAGIFAGEAHSDFLVKHPDSWVLRPSGERIPLGCPNAPATVVLLENWVQVVAETGADVIFWDDPSASGECVCLHCNDRYLLQTGSELSVVVKESQAVFRRQSLSSFVEAVCAAATRRGIRNIVGVLPGSGFLSTAANMQKVDAVSTSPLWRAHGKPVMPYVEEACRDLVAVCNGAGKGTVAWLQAFGIPAGNEDEITLAASIIAASGIEAVAAWSYRAGEPMSSVRSGDPKKAWQAVCDAFQILKEA